MKFAEINLISAVDISVFLCFYVELPALNNDILQTIGDREANVLNLMISPTNKHGQIHLIFVLDPFSP